jgi:predicted dehydrogenase
MDRVKMGLIGHGCRGWGLLEILLSLDDVDVIAVCDKYDDRAQSAFDKVKEKRGNEPFMTTDYKELLKTEGLDAVLISTDWELHIPIAIDAMNAGVAVALEVGGAYSVQDCFDLVDTWEKTKVPFMFMENCCYNRDELLATAMARKGLFGRIVYCSGSYSHDLRNEVTRGKENRHYRLRNYLTRNCENYPTHELGPIAKLLNINRGNRILSLVSVASCAAGLEQYVADHPELVEKDPTLKDRRYNQGDVVSTILTCAGGETIYLKLDTTLPRSYSREFTVRGTKGAYFMDTNTVFMDGDKEYFDPTQVAKQYLDNACGYNSEYMPDCWKEMTEEKRKFGHGGMDAIMFDRFIKCYLEGREMEIDVYDAAAWMCISCLSEKSIAEGGAVQQIPDFTNGTWLIRKPKAVLS